MRQRVSLAAIIGLFLSVAVFSQDNPLWMRYPAIANAKIAFCRNWRQFVVITQLQHTLLPVLLIFDLNGMSPHGEL